jgi:hypothetical protein
MMTIQTNAREPAVVPIPASSASIWVITGARLGFQTIKNVLPHVRHCDSQPSRLIESAEGAAQQNCGSL